MGKRRRRCRDVAMKKCSFCRKKKEFAEFHSKGNGNFMSRCKNCMVTIQANKYRAKKRLEANIDEMRLEQWRGLK